MTGPLLTLAAVVAAVIGVGLLAIMLSPVRVSLRAETAPHRRLRLRIGLLGGLVPALPLYDSDRKKKAPAKAEEARRKPGRGARHTGAAPRPGVAIAALIADLLRQLRFDHLRAEACYGLADPADTGLLCGLVAPIVHGTTGCPGIALALTPDFAGAGLRGTLDAGFRVTPAALLAPLLRFAWRAWGPGAGVAR